MYRLARRLLFLFPPETAHHLVLLLLRALSCFPRACALLRRRLLRGVALETTVAGMRWPTPVGLAAGLDKDALAIGAFFALGFGAVEVGTITPRPQPGNPRPRLFRLPEHEALINRMGFNSRGAIAAKRRLDRARSRPAPLGVNIGKNKDTPLERAKDDYLACVEALAARADYVVVNASSPNTPGLRQLQEPEALTALLRSVRERLSAAAPGRPLFLKIAPDLAPEAVDQIVDVAVACGVDALVCTNTTVQRPIGHPLAGEAGGLSGAPLRALSTAVVRRAYARAAGRLDIVASGGVHTAEDAYEKIRAGACAVQIYTGFVYGGPATPTRISRGLAALLAKDGFASVAAAVGADAGGRRRGEGRD